MFREVSAKGVARSRLRLPLEFQITANDSRAGKSELLESKSLRPRQLRSRGKNTGFAGSQQPEFA
jgi:hypothetical protein